MTGIIYDNISGNTGDNAIGTCIKKILSENNIDFKEGISDTTIIGGGHLLRKKPDCFYDRFRLEGNHILNGVGIVDFPDDLHYLNEYKYVTVRSIGDRNKIQYIKDVYIVPCCSLLLEDVICEQPKFPSIGIHLLPDLFKENIKEFIEWCRSLPYHIYFIPITFYNNDFEYMQNISYKIENSTILSNKLSAEYISSFIGKLDYFISSSLHGAIFAYKHNIPFLLLNTEKMLFFMQDRLLENYLFTSLDDIKTKFCYLDKIDYSELLIHDHKVLNEHIYNIKNLV